MCATLCEPKRMRARALTRTITQVKLRMDFTAISVGTFVYHCHILGHEDGGMMAKVRGGGGLGLFLG